LLDRNNIIVVILNGNKWAVQECILHRGHRSCPLKCTRMWYDMSESWRHLYR